MIGQSPSETYWGDCSVGNHHWVWGQAYPPVKRQHYDTPIVMEFEPDATAVYSVSRDTRQEQWGVSIRSQADQPEHFRIDIPPDLPDNEHYEHLAETLEAQLGRTGLKILVY